MKKLTAGILASLIGLVSANSAEAAVASTKYVDDGLKTKQQKLTSENFKTDGAGQFVTGVTVDANGNVTFATANQAEVTVDDALKQDSVNPVQNKVIAETIASMAATVPADAGNKVVKNVVQANGTVTASYAQVTGADIADGTIATDDIANAAVTSDKIASVAMAKVDGLDTALAGKQNTLTQAANAGEGIKIDDTTGKISADITQTEFDTALGTKQNTLKEGANIQIAADGTISATDTTYTTGTATAEGLTKLYTTTGAETDGTMTQAAITTELSGKQTKLTQAANAGEGITISEDGKIAADVTDEELATALDAKQNKLTAGDFINIDAATGTITTKYSAGTGIKIGTDGAISADNQLDAVDQSGDTGLQVLTRNCNDQGVCSYVWEDIDRTFTAQ